MKSTLLTPTRTRILQAMVAGAVIKTLEAGPTFRAWIFAETFEGILGTLRYTVPYPTFVIMQRNGWLTKTTDPAWWQGHVYRISRKGRAALTAALR
jgi:hypothetical protein